MLPVVLTILMTGCLKENLDPETIVLMGTESEVLPIDSVIPDTLLNFVHNEVAMAPASVLDLPQGNMPPDIQGEFVFSPLNLVGYNADHPNPSPEDTLFLRLGGKPQYYSVEVEQQYYQGQLLIQGNDTLVLQADTTIIVPGTAYYYPDGQHNQIVPCELYGDVLETGNAYQLKKADAFVMGNGNSFTLYFTIPYECEYTNESGTTVAEYTLTRGYIITGSIAQHGIDQAVVACVNKKVEVKGNSTMVPSTMVPSDAIESMANSIYIYRIVGDRPAVRQPWVKP